MLASAWTTKAAQSVTLAWDPSIDTNVTSYVLYYGTASGGYSMLTNVGNRTLATVSNLPPATWYFVVTARDDNTGLESDPSNEVFCNIANLSGSLQFSAASYSGNENSGTMTIVVSRTGGSNGVVAANYATGGGSATAGQDYTATSGTLSWADGDSASKSFTVTLLDDSIVEGNETVNLSLSYPTGGATLGTPASAVLTIIENDVCAFSLSTTSASFGATGGAGSVTVTAQAGCSWTVANPNSWVTINSGSSGNGNGTVNYTVTANTGAITRTATLTIAGLSYVITQTAPPGTLQFSATGLSVSESGPVATITVTRTGGQAGAVGVSYATGGGSATAGQDYTAASGTLSWADGDTAPKTFTVAIVDDSLVESNETVNVALSNPTGGATLGTPAAAVLTITENDACAYSLSAANASFESASGAGSVAVTAQASCAWTVANPNSWITITSGSSGNGNGTVNYTVATNAGTATRIGTLTIAGQAFTITQTAARGSLQFSQAAFTVAENSPTVTITVTRTGGRSGAVGISYTTGSGSATAGQDYTATSGTLSWADGDTASKSFTVTVLDDNTVEGNETVDLSLSNPTGGATLGTPNSAVLTLTENDVCNFVLSASSAAFEAAGGVGNVTVTALNGCAWSAANTNGWITIEAGSTGNGTGVVSYAVAPHTGTTTRTGTLTIAGKAHTVTQTAPRGTLQFSQAGFTAGESGPTATITVTRVGGQSGAVGVRYATSDGSATAGQDYTAASGTLSWADGDATAKSFTVAIINDSAIEPNETVNLTLSSPTGGTTLGSPGTAVLTIIENDACAYSLSVASAVIDAAGGAGSVEVTAQAGCAWTVNNPNSWVTISSGLNGSGNGTVNYTVTANPGTSARSGNLTIAGNVFTLNQAAPSVGTLQFSQINYTVEESAVTAILTVTRTGGQLGAVGVSYATSDGTAVAGQDYTAAVGTLTWADADTTPKTFSILVVNDNIFTGNRALGVSLSNPTGGASLGAPNSASLLILDDDGSSGPDVQSYLVAKGQQFEQASDTVPVLATNEGAYHFLSYVEPSYSGAVTNASVRNNSLQILTPADGVFELERGFTSKSILDTTFGNSSYTFTIQTAKDGVRTPVLKLSSDAYPCTPRIGYWTEAQGVDAAAPFTVTWNPFTNGAPGDFVLLQVTDGSGRLTFSSPGFLEPTALNGTSESVTIPAHALQHGQSYHGRLMFVKRTALDTNSYPGVAGISGFYKETKFRLQTLAPPPSQGRLQFSARLYSADEGAGVGTVTVIRTGGAQGSVGVDIATSDGSAKSGEDYAAASQTLVLGDGVTSATFSFPLLDDVLLEGREAVRLTLGNPTGGAVLGTGTNAVFTIFDNEQTNAGVLQFSVPSYTVTEVGPAAVLTVNRTGGMLGSVTVNFAAVDGSATSGADFVATNGTLVFASGERSKTLSVRIREDYLDEPAENFKVSLTSPSGGAALGSNHTANVLITDNDLGGVISFSAASYSIGETASVATITVKRSSGSASSVTVDFATVDGTAKAGLDYGAIQGTLSFGWNELAKTLTVPILADSLPEGDEAFGLRLSNPTGGASLGAYSNAVLTILDDEQTLQFSSDVFTNSEATASALVTVARTGPAIGTVTVDYSTQDGTASSAADYQGVRGRLTFGPGVTKQTIKVTVTNDTLVEAPESFQVFLSTPTGGAQLGGRTSATVLILDNDFGGVISFTATNFSATESVGNAAVTISRTGGVASGVTVDFTTVDDTATAGVDYSPVSQTISFAANETTKTILVPISRDAFDEPNRTLRLYLNRPTGGASVGARSSAVLTIQDDDVGGVIAFSAAAYSISETGGVATVTVKRSGGSASGVTVSYATFDGTATGEQDYVPTQGTLTFGSNEMTKTFTVSIVPDAIPERDETVVLRLGNPTGGAKLGAISNATLTVITDEIVVGGAYKVTISSRIYGCTDSADNVSVSWVGEWTLVDGTDNTFAGQGVFFNTSLGLATTMSVTGRVFASGIVGNYTTESGWFGTFNGTGSGGKYSVLFGGQTSDGPCRETGSMSVSLANPPAGGFAPARLESCSLRMDIASGSGVLATTGSYQADFADAGYSFNYFPVPAYTPVQDGLFLYTKTASNTATLTMREVNELGGGLDSSVTLTFTSATGGTFSKKAFGAIGTQTGSFTLFR